jgi:hypothetical protein
MKPHYSSKEQMMAMNLGLCRYTYQVDHNSQFVVPFPPTSIHTAVLTPAPLSQVKGMKLRVTPSAHRMYWTILFQEMAIHSHGPHSSSRFNNPVCWESTVGIIPFRAILNCYLFSCHLERLKSVFFSEGHFGHCAQSGDSFLFVTFILS